MPDQPKTPRAGHPVSFLLLSIVGFFIGTYALQLQSPMGGICGMAGLFLAGVCPVAGLVLGVYRWPESSTQEKLTTLILAVVAVLMVLALIPAL